MSNGLVANPQTGEITSPLLEKIKKENKDFKFGEAISRIIANSGIQDWDKIVVDTKDDIDGKMEQDAQKLQAMMSSIQSMQGVGTIPPQPAQSGQIPQETQQMPMQQEQLPQGGIPNV
jgi:hypothetical protein